MDIVRATREYEKWLRRATPVLPAGLALKHRLMAESPFAFLRATFYRWMQQWPKQCKELQDAPVVLAIGDLHIENFGTWRDDEGRLVWGVNDFDEAARLPYVIDLVRLATSVLLAVAEGGIAVKPKDACAAILAGYREGLAAGGKPFVLAEQHPWMLRIAEKQIHAPPAFWDKLTSFRKVPKSRIPGEVTKRFEEVLPRECTDYAVVLREAGLGSRGQQRLVAVAEHGASLIAREAKALRQSAVTWALAHNSPQIHYREIMDSSVRARDPHVHVFDKWLVRRLAPDCSRIEVSQFPEKGYQLRLLNAMGWETANVHLGSRQTKAILRDLDRRGKKWLLESARSMKKVVQKDWSDWRKSQLPAKR